MFTKVLVRVLALLHFKDIHMVGYLENLLHDQYTKALMICAQWKDFEKIMLASQPSVFIAGHNSLIAVPGHDLGYDCHVSTYLMDVSGNAEEGLP